MKKNIIANYIGRIWGFVSVYLFVPYYIDFLGINAYGLVGFFSALMGVLAFVDLGLTSTLNRELARLAVKLEGAREMRDMLRSYEVLYIGISLMVAFLVAFAAPFISNQWLQNSVLPPSEVVNSIQLMGVAIALQMISGLYLGGLSGLQKQVESNVIRIIWSLIRNVGSVLAIWLYSPTIVVFASCQVFACIVYFGLSRSILWKNMTSSDEPPRFRLEIFKQTWKYSLGMLGMSLIGMILLNTDKLVVSKLLSLESLGYFTLAATLSLAPRYIASPVGIAVFPRFSGLVELGEKEELIRLYHRTSLFFGIIVFPVTLTLAFFAKDMIFIWTGSRDNIVETGLAATFMIVGQMFQAMQVLPYYIALANGNVRVNLVIGLCSIVILIPLMLYLIPEYGIVGAGLSWFLMNAVTGPVFLYFIHWKFLKGQFGIWLSKGVLRIIFITLPILWAGTFLINGNESRIEAFLKIGIVGMVCLLANAVLIKEVRMPLVEFTRQRLNRS